MLHHRTCCLCEALCGLEIEHDGSRVTAIRGHEADVLSRGHICPKATALKEIHEDSDRLRQPMRRQGERFVPVSWDAALDEAADRIQAIQARHGRDAFAVYSGNPTAHNYATLLSGLAFAEVTRTKSRFSATSVDQLPHMLAGLEMFGHQLLLPVPDIDHTDLLIVMGGNPLISNGSLMTAPGVGKRLRAIRERGGRVVVLDPRRTETADVADAHHAVRPGTDGMLLMAMLQTVFAEGLVADGPWRAMSTGLDALDTAAQPFTPERVAGPTGVPAEVTRELARSLATTKRAVIYGRLGTCTQAFGGLNSWLLVALNTVTGHLDSRGGAMFTEPAVDLMKLAAKSGQGGHFGVWKSRVRGLPEFGGELPAVTMAEEIETEGPGQIRALMTVAGNPVLSTPNGAKLAGALAGLEFMVSLDPWITATSRHAHLILPPLSPLERDHFGLAFHALAVRNTVAYSPPLFEPPAGSYDDWQTILTLAERIADRQPKAERRLGPTKLRWMRGVGPRRLLDMLIRGGRAGGLLNLRGPRLTLDKLIRTPGGVDLGPLEPCLADRIATPDRKIRLAPSVFLADVPRLERAVADAELTPGALVLIGRRQLRNNNSWLHNAPKMVSGKPRCTLLMHPEDATRLGLGDGQSVRVQSRVGAVVVPLATDLGMMPGVVSLPHGFGHSQKGAQMATANEVPGASINDLTDETFIDPLTGTAALSGVPVAVEAA
ncbi:MAG: molybdopterin-dependent oxidoreductase [Myxococcota bacterium]